MLGLGVLVPTPDTDDLPIEADADFTEEEIARRRDEVARRMLSTPYAPQKPKGDASASKPKKRKKAQAKA